MLGEGGCPRPRPLLQRKPPSLGGEQPAALSSKLPGPRPALPQCTREPLSQPTTPGTVAAAGRTKPEVSEGSPSLATLPPSWSLSGAAESPWMGLNFICTITNRVALGL